MGYEQEEVQHHSRAKDDLYIYRTPATCKRSIETDPTLRSPKNYMMRYNKKEKKNVSYTKQSDDGPLILASQPA